MACQSWSFTSCALLGYAIDHRTVQWFFSDAQRSGLYLMHRKTVALFEDMLIACSPTKPLLSLSSLGRREPPLGSSFQEVGCTSQGIAVPNGERVTSEAISRFCEATKASRISDWLWSLCNSLMWHQPSGGCWEKCGKASKRANNEHSHVAFACWAKSRSCAALQPVYTGSGVSLHGACSAAIVD